MNTPIGSSFTVPTACASAKSPRTKAHRHGSNFGSSSKTGGTIDRFFNPMWADNTTGAIFPKEVYLSDATIMGVQHYYLARMLLTAHDPNVPKLGPGRIAALEKSNVEIKAMVRTICGIAEVRLASPGDFG